MSEIQSLARGLKILDLLATHEGLVSVTEIAETLDIDKSSASRLVNTLANYGYAEQDTDSRRFRLGSQVIVLSRHLLQRMPLHDHARPYLDQLVEQTGECAHIAVYVQGKAFVIADVETTATLRVSGGVGRLIPLHCTAIGKALLAYCDIAFPAKLEAHTPRTITDAAQLRLHMEQIRHQGYSVDDEEDGEGVRCLAAPVYDYSGLAIAAMGISGPAVRVTPETIPALAQQVMELAEQLSLSLGYQANYHEASEHEQ